MMLILIIIFLLFFKTKKEESVQLSFEQTQSTKGICSVFIMLGHIGACSELQYIYPIEKMGVLIVGIFFFLSGYYICLNLDSKKNYIHTFLSKHISKLITPVFISYAFKNIVLFMISTGSINNKWLSFEQFFDYVNWFVYIIFALYILTYIIFKFLRKNRVWILIIIILFSMNILYLIGANRLMYGGAICYGIGALYYKYPTLISKSKNIKWLSLTTSILLISTYLFYIFGEYTYLGDFIFRNIAIICFTILSVVAIYKFKIVTKFNAKLGEISYEIYIVHLMLLQWYLESSYHLQSEILIFLIVVLTIFLSFLLHYIDNIVIKYFFDPLCCFVRGFHQKIRRTNSEERKN